MTNNIIKENKEIHDKISSKYDSIHGEIFTKIEQKRLLNLLNFAKSSIKTKNKIKSALDIGCGSGNLSNFLLKIGFKTTGADISANFLKLVKKKFAKKFGNNFSTILLNGENLDNIKNNSFDFVGLYSVLHHVPDYLKMVEEMYKVTKKGGIVYIDHEVNSNYWNPSKDYLDFKKKVRFGYLKGNFFTLFNFKSLITKIKQIKSPRYRPEGDLHVFKDDHIEWDKIKSLVENLGGEIILNKNYLLYKKGYDLQIYMKYQKLCDDYKVMAFRKN